MRHRPPQQAAADRRTRAARVLQRAWRRAAAAGPAAPHHGAPPDAEAEDARRQRLLTEYGERLEHRERLLQANFSAQRRLVQWFHEKRLREPERASLEPQASAEMETRYLQWLKHLRDERRDLATLRSAHATALEAARARHRTAADRAESAEAELKEQRAEAVGRAEFPRTGKRIPAETLERLSAAEEEREEDVQALRVAAVRLRNRLQKLTALLREKEALSDGLHLIDFEQLKIENGTLGEKIEERGEDLLKLRKKAAATLHVLTHSKEKLACVQDENERLRGALGQTEDEAAGLRECVNQGRRDRDALAADAVALKERAPLVGAADLLADYGALRTEAEGLRAELAALHAHHRALTTRPARRKG